MKHFRVGVSASFTAILCSVLLAACSPSANLASETRAVVPTLGQPIVPTAVTITAPTLGQTAPPTSTRFKTASPTARPTSTRMATRTATRTATRKASSKLDCTRTLVGGTGSRLPTIQLSDLLTCRPEARTTLRLIRQNGPFRYRQDDATFQNRERHLPAAPRDTYREYTVITPAESDRGARRMISSGDASRQPADYDTLYFTDDHYDTFWVVKEQ